MGEQGQGEMGVVRSKSSCWSTLIVPAEFMGAFLMLQSHSFILKGNLTCSLWQTSFVVYDVSDGCL